MSLHLYSYFRSSAAFRVRIALNLKGVHYTIEPVNLATGQQREAAFRQMNPQGFVPALRLPGGEVLTQSTAIIEWLEQQFPAPALLPSDPIAKARIRAVCSLVACDIHPLNNLRVLNYLEERLELGKDAREAWYHHWLGEGFTALEPQIEDAGFVAGASPGMAEAFIIPQVFNAHRFRFDMEAYPRVQGLYERCLEMEAFARAHPQAQPDAV